MVKKISIIEDLAIMVAEEFINVRRDIKSADEANEERIKDVEIQMKEGFDHTHARLSTIERDIAEIRKHFVYRDEFEDLMGRVKYLERKLGIVSGK